MNASNSVSASTGSPSQSLWVDSTSLDLPGRILVVDDNANNRELMRRILADEFLVDTACDGSDALVQISACEPDALFVDLEMPRMDGMTFLQKIIREDPIPVVVCSALTGHETTIGLQALEQGAVEVVTKPRLGVKDFLFESAVTLIDAVRAAHRSRQNIRRQPPRSPVPRRTDDAAGTRKIEESLARNTGKVVAIGASTGGTEAFQ